jgi:hypothetical protein
METYPFFTMRSLLSILAIAGLAAVVCAQGVVVINEVTYEDPSQCISNLTAPLTIVNESDRSLLVFEDAACSGQVVGDVSPFGSGVFDRGQSVLPQ